MAKLNAHLVGTDLGLGDGRTPLVRKGAAGAAGAAALGAAAAAGKALVDRRSARRGREAKQAYRLARDETVPDGVRRMARGQIEAAIELLGGDGNREAAVHETRKALKRVRTLLRLARGDLDSHTYRSENDSIRQIGRRLAVARDSQVMVETLEAVSERFSAEMPLEAIEDLRSTLLAEHREAQERLDADEVLLGSAISQLEAARGRVPGWTFVHEDFRALAPGLRRVYRRGRRAAKAARREPSTENLHELRKRVKDLWHAARVLRRVGPTRMKRLRRDAHEVSDLLGENHDLALLRTKALRHRRELTDPAALIALLGVIDRRRTQLEHKALDRADRLYATKPGAFVRAVERRWRKRMRGGAEAVAA
jgi:CHAD domain-containing protein